MNDKPKIQDRVERRYKRVRGNKTFRLPPGERSFPLDEKNPHNKHRDVLDNNPGRAPPAPNPDEL